MNNIFKIGKIEKLFRIQMLIVVAILFSSFTVLAQEQPTTETNLSLKDAILTAFKNNRDIQIQEKEVEVANANILEATSAFLPNLGVSGAYAHNNKTLQPQNIFSGFQNDNKISLALNQSIYNGGSNIASFKQAKLNLDAAQETLKAVKLDVEFEVKRLYFGLLLAYDTERIAQELLNQAQSHYDDVQKKFKEGTASRFDVLQSKVQVSKVTPELVKAKNSADLIEAELKKLLGLKLEILIKLNGNLGYNPIEIKEEVFLKQAYLNKPEMILKSLGVDINKWAVENAKSSYRPQVSLQANYSYRSNDIGDMINQAHNTWNAGVAVSMPIFDGLASKAKVDAAKAKYAQASLDKQNLSEQIAVDVRKSCLDLAQSGTIIDSLKDSVSEAKEALRLAQISYDNGEATNLEILDAQVSLSQIEQNYSNAIYDYIMASASLDRTMGKTFLQGENDEKK